MQAAAGITMLYASGDNGDGIDVGDDQCGTRPAVGSAVGVRP
ncbi:MAG: hypothetical protein R2700_04430 [Solirubrobacterales bacterium]